MPGRLRNTYVATTSQLAPGVGGGNFVLIEEKTISTATDTVTFTGLDSSTEKRYLLAFSVLSGGTGPDYSIRFNGDATATNYYTESLTTDGSTVSTSLSNSNHLTGGTVNTTNIGYFIIIPTTDSTRYFCYITRSTISAPVLHNFGAVWNNTATITSITFYGSNTGIQAGSKLALFKMV